MSSFAANDRGIDPYDIDRMQQYVDEWSETDTDVLVYVKEGVYESAELLLYNDDLRECDASSRLPEW